MPTSIKAALKKWEEATGRKAGESKEIKLIGVYPPIEKMEGPFHLLINCEKFSLSTNQIVSISNLQAFKTLKVLSLGRNNIKSLQGIEGAAESLEQLWISYNQIDRLKPIRNLLRLKVMYLSHNYVREWREFEHLTELPCLEDLVFIGNPLEEEASANGKYQDEVTKVISLFILIMNMFLSFLQVRKTSLFFIFSSIFQRLLYLKKLDGYPVIRNVEVAEEDDDDEKVLLMDEIERMANEGDEEDEEDADKEEKEEGDEDEDDEGDDDDVDSQNSSEHDD